MSIASASVKHDAAPDDQAASTQNSVQSWKEDLLVSIRLLIREYGKARSELLDSRKAGEDQMRNILLRLLDTLDAFERVLGTYDPVLGKGDRKYLSMHNNMKTLKSMLNDVLEEHGVREIIYPEGRASIMHCRILGTEQHDAIPDMTIMDTVEKGYFWNDQVLRKSAVIVVKK